MRACMTLRYSNTVLDDFRFVMTVDESIDGLDDTIAMPR